MELESVEYTSSPQTFLFKYIMPPLLIIFGMAGIVVLINQEDEQVQKFAIAFGIAFAWMLIFILQIPFNLKKIKVNESGLTVLSKQTPNLISFDKVLSVSLFSFSNPWMITVRYLCPDRKEEKKLSYMPNQKDGQPLKLDKMTNYIIERAKSSNPNYIESSIVKNLMILLVAGLPAVLGIIYFLLGDAVRI